MKKKKKCGRIIFCVILEVLVTRKNSDSKETKAHFKRKSALVNLLKNSLAF
jgi:hypothetical protein